MKKKATIRTLAWILASIVLITIIATGVYFFFFHSAVKADGPGADFLKGNKKLPTFTDEQGLKAVDEDMNTVWQVPENDAYTQITFEQPTSINTIQIKENGSWVRKYHLEAWNGKNWVNIYENDLIEGDYQAVIDDIKTSAIRMYIDDGKGAKIAQFSASYLSPVEYDRPFINMSYITTNQYYHEWFPDWDAQMTEKTFSSLTDLCLLGSFRINAKGEFVITAENYGIDNSIKAVYPALSDQADILMNGNDLSELGDITGQGYQLPENKKGALPFLRSKLGSASPKLWFSLTVLSDPAFGGISAENLTAFQDQNVIDQFAQTVVDFAKKYGFSGVDIDWEYPAGEEAWNSYKNLINCLSEKLHAEGLLFSSAQTITMMNLSAETLNKFDRIHLMSYDQAGRTTTKHHSNYQVSTVQEIQYYLDLGVSPEKLVVGLAYYSSPQQTGWSTIFEQMQEYIEPDQKISLGINSFQKYTFNNVNLIQDRTLYAITQKIGGVFSWHISCDMPWDHYASLAHAQDKTIQRFVKQP